MYLTKTNLNEGKHITGIKCTECGKVYTGENWDALDDWIYDNDEHYCPDCQGICDECHEYFSLSYIVNWFKDGLCENCQ